MGPAEIRAMRGSLGLTQRAFGGQVGVHASTVSSWERGRHRPAPRNLAALRALGGAPASAGPGRALARPAAAPPPRPPRAAPVRLAAERHQLVLADCFDVLPELAPSSIDALITDPPYSSGGLYASERAKPARVKYEKSTNLGHRADFSGDQRDQHSWRGWSFYWLRLCWQALKPGGVLAVFCDWRQLGVLSEAIQMADFMWLGVAIWDKTEGARPAPGRPRNQAEYILWGSRGRWVTRPGVPVLPGVHREAIRQRDKHHLTGKPLAVMRWLVKMCPPGGLIFDPFAGSGSTGVAALLEGRRFLGVERDPHHHAIAERRLAAAAEGRILDSAASGGQLQRGPLTGEIAP